jgi:hypothetical protein
MKMKVMINFIICTHHIIKECEMARHVTCMGVLANVYYILIGKPQRKRPLERRGPSGGVMLKWILEKQDVRRCTGSRWGPAMGFCEPGNKQLVGSIKQRNF